MWGLGLRALTIPNFQVSVRCNVEAKGLGIAVFSFWP